MRKDLPNPTKEHWARAPMQAFWGLASVAICLGSEVEQPALIWLGALSATIGIAWTIGLSIRERRVPTTDEEDAYARQLSRTFSLFSCGGMMTLAGLLLENTVLQIVGVTLTLPALLWAGGRVICRLLSRRSGPESQ